MTGQGQARGMGPRGTLVIELRTINNRHFKLSPRWGEGLAVLEPKVESFIRTRIARGTMHLNAAWQRTDQVAFRIHEATVSAYYHQLSQIQKKLGPSAPLDMVQLATLPGAVEPTDDATVDADELWNAFQRVLSDAIDQLDSMRQKEGEAMGNKLLEDLQVIADSLSAIQQRAPRVVEQYRERMLSRVQTSLREFDIQVQSADLLREVQVFADRGDISEEITRLTSHLQMFRRSTAEEAAAGRKLDFVIQEMFREANTIGSKANDAEIAGYVVEIKCAIERMRELVQNLE